MKDFIFKIHVLFWLLQDQWQLWKKEVWQRNLDEHFCCNGYMCGCQGITVREEWDWRLKNN